MLPHASAATVELEHCFFGGSENLSIKSTKSTLLQFCSQLLFHDDDGSSGSITWWILLMLLGRVRKTDTISTGCNIFHSVLCSFLWLTTTLAFLVSDLFCKLAIALIYVCVCVVCTQEI